VRSSDYSQRLAAGRASVTEARAAATLAEQNYERAKNLFEANAISKSDLDTQRAHYDTARATVENAIAQSNQAGIALADTVLAAPMDGVILARHVEVGTLVSPGTPGFTIADTRTVKAVFGAPQTLVERLHPGSPLNVYVGADGDVKGSAKIAAQVTRIAPSAESSGRVFSVEASLPNPDGGLRVGSIISVRVPEAALASETLVVPIAAVVRSPKTPGGFAVFVLEGDGDRAPARLHEVRLGEVVGNGVIVMEGIAAGQRVVTRGATLLHDGDEALVIR
jgi:multidrug efflux system membrane fusion protein